MENRPGKVGKAGKMEKILSFIIPAYNCEKYLDKCIQSMLQEEILGALDIIIVNDGSTDHTEDVAKRYCRDYPETVRLISQENKGHGGALNTGCRAACGKYLKVIDADDWVETQNLPQYIKMLQNCGCEVVLTHHYTRNISSGEVKKWRSYPDTFGKAYDFAYIMAHWKSFDRSLTFHGITYRTDFYQKYGMHLSEHVFYEDHEFATVPCCYASEIMPFDFFIYNYRIGDVEQSVSDENQLKRISHTEAVLRRLIKEYGRLALPEDAPGRRYYCMKTQGLLLSYMTTVMLVERCRRKGRKMGNQMMGMFRVKMPEVYQLAVKQFCAFKLMNYLHIDKNGWEKILRSDIYNKLRNNHDFS